MGIQILGTGSFIPKRAVDNKQLFKNISNFDRERAEISLSKKSKINPTKINDYADEDIFDLWVKQVCGIERRCFLDPEQDSLPTHVEVESMGAIAAEKAIADAGMDIADIDHIIFSTYSAEMIVPPPVCKIKGILQITDPKVSGITLNAVCNGFIEAMRLAAMDLQTQNHRNVLVIAAEYMSNKINFEDPKSCILFADGAGACVVSRNDEVPYGEASRLNYSSQIHMQKNLPISLAGGPLVERHAVNSMYEVLSAALEDAKLQPSDVGMIIPHQANGRIIESLREKISQTYNSSKVINSIQNVGNLSSASIIVAIDQFRHQKIEGHFYQKGLLGALTAVGGGYTYGSIIVQL